MSDKIVRNDVISEWIPAMLEEDNLIMLSPEVAPGKAAVSRQRAAVFVFGSVPRWFCFQKVLKDQSISTPRRRILTHASGRAVPGR